MPTAKIMQLYKQHAGKHFVKATCNQPQLDITASRTANTIFLHVVNTNRTDALTANINIQSLNIKSARAWEISADPTYEILSAHNDLLLPQEKKITPGQPYSFTAASVTVIELDT